MCNKKFCLHRLPPLFLSTEPNSIKPRIGHLKLKRNICPFATGLNKCTLLCLPTRAWGLFYEKGEAPPIFSRLKKRSIAVPKSRTPVAPFYTHSTETHHLDLPPFLQSQSLFISDLLLCIHDEPQAMGSQSQSLWHELINIIFAEYSHLKRVSHFLNICRLNRNCSNFNKNQLK